MTKNAVILVIANTVKDFDIFKQNFLKAYPTVTKPDRIRYANIDKYDKVRRQDYLGKSDCYFIDASRYSISDDYFTSYCALHNIKKLKFETQRSLI